MAVAGVVDVRHNPNDLSQRVVLWGNGRLDCINTAPVTDGPEFYMRLDQPVVVAVHVVTWGATTSGYMLDVQGGFHIFGGAPAIGTKSTVFPTDTHYIVTGVPYVAQKIYRDWAWDPNTPGRGVALDGFGTLHPFGGAPTPPRPLNRWANADPGRKLEMQWTPDVRAYTLDLYGGIHHDYAAAQVPGYTRWLGGTKVAGDAPYWLWNDTARDFQITDWTAAPKGYTMDRFGTVIAWGGAAAAIGYPRGAGDWARTLRVLSASNPLRFWLVSVGAQHHEWNASTTPTVVAGGLSPFSPADPTTGTTRPSLQWTYSDLEKDTQAEVRLMVFTQAFVTANNMADPTIHKASALVDQTVTDSTVRGVVSPVDLANGTYRMYVRVKDTSGLYSAWSNRGWTQSVTPPATPTGLTATVNGLTVNLSVAASAGTYVRFEYQDAGETSWKVVEGADAAPRIATTTAVDRFPAFGKVRTYRAIAYSVDPRVSSTASATATASVNKYVYALNAVDDPAIGGEVNVAGPFEWTRPVSGGIFDGLGAEFPVVVSDGVPKARRGQLNLITESKAQWAVVEALVEADSVLVLRDPFGEVVYCRAAGDWKQTLMEAVAPLGEPQPFRHMHSTSFPLVEVQPPSQVT